MSPASETNEPHIDPSRDESLNILVTTSISSTLLSSDANTIINAPLPPLLSDKPNDTVEVSDPANFFQSSNYFNSNSSAFVPVGSEILFGIENNFTTDRIGITESNTTGTNV